MEGQENNPVGTGVGESAGAAASGTAGATGATGASGTGETGGAGETGGQNPQGTTPPAPTTPAPSEADGAPATPVAGNWYDTMPENWRATMQGFGSAEDAMAALQRGQAYQPATDANAIDLGWPEGTPVDKGQEQRYREACVRLGLTASQAKNVAQWQLQEMVNSQTEQIRAGTQALQGRWGTQYEPNRQAALSALTTLDRCMDGRLAPALAARGVTNDPVMIEALHAISTMISEDALGGGGQAGGQMKAVSTEDFVKELFANGK